MIGLIQVLNVFIYKFSDILQAQLHLLVRERIRYQPGPIFSQLLIHASEKTVSPATYLTNQKRVSGSTTAFTVVMFAYVIEDLAYQDWYPL